MKMQLTNTYLLGLFLLGLLVVSACESAISGHLVSNEAEGSTLAAPPSFKLLPATQTGISFQNTIQEDDNLNYFNYMHLYIGGGVVIFCKKGTCNRDG